MSSFRDIKEYKKAIKENINNKFQREVLNNFVVAYREARTKVFKNEDLENLREKISNLKKSAIENLRELYLKFKEEAEKKGVKVYYAEHGAKAKEIILDIAKKRGTKLIVKSKSMTSEEIKLNPFLLQHGIEVVETDLGEWIIQLRGEGPSHMVMPAIHLSRHDVARLFAEKFGEREDLDIEELVKVARKRLREKFISADIGITGANFAVAESGTIGIVSNEGNARLVTTLPPVHIAIIGIDKLVYSLEDAHTILNGLTKNATAQNISTYVSWISGTAECKINPNNQKNLHIIFLDNGRYAISKDPIFKEVLKCVRCGACANVCPIYRIIGGHVYGHIYIGAIGLILTYFYHGIDADKFLIENCINCHACKDVCIAKVDLPYLINKLHSVILNETQQNKTSHFIVTILKNRNVFHSILRIAKFIQRPIKDNEGYIRHLPLFLFKNQSFRKLPALAKEPFRDIFPRIKKEVSSPIYQIALFTGCLQDFVYPDHLIKGVDFLQKNGIKVSLPLLQGCCGLPALMLGEEKMAQEIAQHNINIIDPCNYDYIITLCASCASHLKKNYPILLRNKKGIKVKADLFASKVMDFSSFIWEKLRDRLSPSKIQHYIAYHYPCHLIRGINVVNPPINIIKALGHNITKYGEEDVCCGFGGSYSIKFPDISKEIVHNKIEKIKNTRATILVTDCPGCILQLKGTLKKENIDIKVKHISQLLEGKN